MRIQPWGASGRRTLAGRSKGRNDIRRSDSAGVVMRNVIQKVLETEAEAKRLVEAAKAEAEDILSKARKQAQELLAQARREARAEAERMVEAAVKEAERERQERLARAAAEIKTQVRLDEPVTRRAVEGVVLCVCGQQQPAQAPLP
jgi:vacuolar-type H+-ATPase subunit H